MRKLRQLDARINFLMNAVAFVIIIAAIVMLILPYRARLERDINQDAGQSAEPNTEVERN